MNRFNRELIGLHSERWHTLEFMFLCWSSQDIQNPGACEASMHLLCPQLDSWTPDSSRHLLTAEELLYPLKAEVVVAFLMRFMALKAMRSLMSH